MKRTRMLIIAALMSLAASAQGVNESRIVTDTIQSKVLGVKRAYTVLLPKGFDSGDTRRYPVLYLLHGMWGKNDDWVSQGRLKDVVDRLVASGEARPMVIVTPDAGGGDPNVYQNGYFDMDGWKYETFFFTELVPFIEKQFRTGGSKANRAIAGLSMGGGGATAYGLRHPDMFCAVYAMSALMDIPDGREADAEKPDGKLAKLTRSVIDHSCVQFVAEADSQSRERLRSVQWFVDCGDDDFLLDRNIDFTRAMRHAAIPCQFRVRDGVHDWEYWHTALYLC
ncbi:MAG: alpha/beta hydrolase-fold protein, partial [Prevotella sp.]|nr:alpha/beta hydrolase-fold protein [Prevotella sp.]